MIGAGNGSVGFGRELHGHVHTFIRIAEDCPVGAAEVPAGRAKASVAELQHHLLIERPYALTEEQLYVLVYGLRQGLGEREISRRWDALHAELYAKPQASMRASPLIKRYGYGAHYDAEGRTGLHTCGSEAYDRMARDPGLTQLVAMRSTRR